MALDLANAWNAVVDVGKNVVEGAKDFGESMVKTVKNDAKDLVRVSSFSPAAILADGVTNGGYRNLKNDVFRQLGVSENDIRDMDYRNHSILDNAGALANTIFNVGTTAIGAPGAAAAAKGTIAAGKAGTNALKGGYVAAKSGKNAAKAARNFVSPKNWQKSQEIIKTKPGSLEIWKKPASTHYVSKPGQPIRTGYNERVVLTGKDGQKYVPQIKITEPAKYQAVTKIRNPSFEAARQTAEAQAAKASKYMKESLAQGKKSFKYFKENPRSLGILGPVSQDSAEAEQRSKGLRRASSSIMRNLKYLW